MPRPTFIGMDPSWTGFALCAGWSDDGKDFNIVGEQRFATKPDKFPHIYARLDYIVERVMGFVDEYMPDAVAIEGYSRGSKQGREEAGLLGGTIRHRLIHEGIRIIDASPSSLKKYVTGRGNAKKEEMMMRAAIRWKYEAANNDACDAYCLMRLAWDQQAPKKTKALETILKGCEVIGA